MKIEVKDIGTKACGKAVQILVLSPSENNLKIFTRRSSKINCAKIN